jgi:tRNA modification GTPase
VRNRGDGAAAVSDCRAKWRYRLSSPVGSGAIAILDVYGELESFFAQTKLPPLGIGQVRLCELLGVDTGLVARFSARQVQLMPHGGRHITSTLLGALHELGGQHETDLDDQSLVECYPEANDIHEARMLEALPRATCQRTVELLLDQPRRWRACRHDPASVEIENHARVLNRLLHPPMVVLLGEANIGKSTLTNALAQESVSIVSAQPGTTRDHVGVELLLDGLAVRWVDTPGWRGGDIPRVERLASQAAREIAQQADLVLLCSDASTSCPAWEPRTGQLVMHVGLRSDLGLADGVEAQTAAGHDATGVGELSVSIRERLVPEARMTRNVPWRFWNEGTDCGR